MRNSTSGGLALVVAGAALVFSPLGDKVAQAVISAPASAPGASGFTVEARLPPVAGAPVPLQPSVPTSDPEPGLTAAQQEAAAKAVSADASLASLSGGRPYQIIESVPWTEPETSDVVGANLTIEMSDPASADVVLPGARFDDAGNRYQRRPYRVRVKGVKTVTALVDFRAGNQVVDIAPGEQGTVEELPGNTHFQPRDGGQGR